nr:TetR/AcrR family transcriptional regulator C-terminal domain-containing protein [Micromonospora sp. DSM 115978]
DFELRAVDGIGLSVLEMDSVVTLVNSFVSGVARVPVDAAAAEALTGNTDEQWWYAHEPILSKVMDPTRFPLASRVGQAFGEAYNAAYEPNQGFEFGLERVLDGVEVLVRSRNSTGNDAGTGTGST